MQQVLTLLKSKMMCSSIQSYLYVYVLFRMEDITIYIYTNSLNIRLSFKKEEQEESSINSMLFVLLHCVFAGWAMAFTNPYMIYNGVEFFV